MMSPSSRAKRSLFAVIASLCMITASHAQGVEQFYRGKQIRFIIHTTPGGAYDLWARILVPYLSKYIPGQPTFLPQNMPGAGGLVAANYLYSVAPRDGSVIGMVGRNVPSDAVMSPGNITFDPRKFQWLGNPEKGSTVAVMTDRAPVRSAAELFEKEILVGGAGAGSAVSLMPTVIRNLLGMKFKLVEGYGSQSAIMLALERGEVHGTFATLTAVQTSFPKALETGKLRILFNLEKDRKPGLDAPTIFDFAKTEEDRQILELLSVSSEVGRPLLAPPDVPADKVAVLRQAFDLAMKDPQLQAEASKLGLPVGHSVSGQDLQQIVTNLMATPPRVVARMAEVSRE